MEGVTGCPIARAPRRPRGTRVARSGVMARNGVVALGAALALVAPGQAWAEGLEDCEALYLEAAFDATRRCLAAEMARSEERPTALRDAYALLAATELAAEREAEARHAVDVARAIDPAFQPTDPM